MKKLLFSFLSFLMFNSCVTEKVDVEGVGLNPGDRLPAFSIVMNDNNVISNETLKGKPSLIVFFHTECPDCQNGFPAIQQAYEKFSGVAEFVAIGTGEDFEKLEEYWKMNNLTIPFSAQPNRDIFHLFAPNTIPHVFVVDRIGVVRFVHKDNPVATYEQLEKEIFSVVK